MIKNLNFRKTGIVSQSGGTIPSVKISPIYEVLNLTKISNVERLISNEIPEVIKSLKGDEKVYFSKDVIFPRETFRSKFPNAKIKRKIEDADVVVLQNNKFTKWQYLYLYRDNISYYTHDRTLRSTSTSNNSAYVYYINEDIYELITKKHKKIIYVPDLTKISSNVVEMTPELFRNLLTMLNSKNKSDCQAGLQMLTALDFNKHEIEIAYLLYKTRWKNSGATLNVQTKALMNSLSMSESAIPDHDMILVRLMSLNIEDNETFIQNQIKQHLSIFDDILDIEFTFKPKKKEINEETSTQS